jgi:hypothetical protein
MNNTLPAFEAGPSDMAAQILQFGRQFMLDFGDDKRMEATRQARQLAKDNTLGGWGDEVAVQGLASRGDRFDDETAQVGKSNGTAKDPRDGCNIFLRPTVLLGLDIAPFLEVGRWEKHFDGVFDEDLVGHANPLHAMEHALQAGSMSIGVIQ